MIISARPLCRLYATIFTENSRLVKKTLTAVSLFTYIIDMYTFSEKKEKCLLNALNFGEVDVS